RLGAGLQISPDKRSTAVFSQPSPLEGNFAPATRRRAKERVDDLIYSIKDPNNLALRSATDTLNVMFGQPGEEIKPGSQQSLLRKTLTELCMINFDMAKSKLVRELIIQNPHVTVEAIADIMSFGDSFELSDNSH